MWNTFQAENRRTSTRINPVYRKELGHGLRKMWGRVAGTERVCADNAA
jgi:hypothetical protein